MIARTSFGFLCRPGAAANRIPAMSETKNRIETVRRMRTSSVPGARYIQMTSKGEQLRAVGLEENPGILALRHNMGACLTRQLHLTGSGHGNPVSGGPFPSAPAPSPPPLRWLTVAGWLTRSGFPGVEPHSKI